MVLKVYKNLMQDTLLKRSLIYAVGNIGSKFLLFALVPLYTFYLTQEELGVYDLMISMINLSIPLITFQLSDAVFRWLRDKSSVLEKSVLVSTVFVFLVGVLCFFSIGAYVISHLIDEVKFLEYLIFISFLNSFYVLALQTARGLGFSRLYAVSGLLYAISFLVANVVFLVLLSMAIEGLLISNIIALFVVNIFLIVRTRLYDYVALRYFSFSGLYKYLGYSLPLLPNTISWWAINTVTKFFILFYIGSQSNGVYAVSTKFATILYLVNSVFQLAWQESAIDEYNGLNRNSYFNAVFQKFLKFQILLVIILIPIGKILICFFVEDSFSDAWQFLPILYVSVALQALSGFLGTGYISYRQSLGAMRSSLIGAFSSVAFSFAMIPHFGLFGAAFSSLTGMLVLFLYRLWDTRRFFRVTVPFKSVSLLFLGVLVSIFFTIMFPVSMLLPVMVLGTVFFIFNRRSALIQILRNRK